MQTKMDLNSAIEWANWYNLFIQIGIYESLGSQNGFDNSGKYTEISIWLENELNMNLTYGLGDYVLNLYGNHGLWSDFGHNFICLFL